MGLYSTNRFRNLTAEYVEEIMKPVTENEAPDVSDPVSDRRTGNTVLSAGIVIYALAQAVS